MKAILDEVVPGVELPEGRIYFSIKAIPSSRFVAEPDCPDELPKRLAAHYSRIRLTATDILTANDELRNLLKPLGQLQPSHFWFNVGAPSDRRSIDITDNDPAHHRIISIGGDLPSDSTQKTAFVQAVKGSKFVEKMPYWSRGDLYVQLRQLYAHKTRRLETYTALVELL